MGRKLRRGFCSSIYNVVGLFCSFVLTANCSQRRLRLLISDVKWSLWRNSIVIFESFITLTSFDFVVGFIRLVALVPGNL
jgi:uncharacterized membrane protein required for colicin V production